MTLFIELEQNGKRYNQFWFVFQKKYPIYLSFLYSEEIRFVFEAFSAQLYSEPAKWSRKNQDLELSILHNLQTLAGNEEVQVFLNYIRNSILHLN